MEQKSWLSDWRITSVSLSIFLLYGCYKTVRLPFSSARNAHVQGIDSLLVGQPVESLGVLFLQMAKAGFIHTPSENSPDTAMCFFCLKELEGWEPEDEPM